MGPVFLTVEFSGSHSLTPHSVGIFRAGKQLVTEDATYATQNKYKKRISIPSQWNSKPQAHKPAAADTRPRPRDLRDWQYYVTNLTIFSALSA
jgi:hypothetical protein